MNEVESVLADLPDEVPETGPVKRPPEREHPGDKTCFPELGSEPSGTFGGSHWDDMVPPAAEFLCHSDDDQLGPSGAVGFYPQTDPQRHSAHCSSFGLEYLQDTRSQPPQPPASVPAGVVRCFHGGGRKSVDSLMLGVEFLSGAWRRRSSRVSLAGEL